MLPLKDHNPSGIVPVVTWSLIALNIVCFLYELAAPDLEAFIFTFALVPSQVDVARPLTLLPFISSMFLHGGWLHLISNMWFLRLFGDNAESYFGRGAYLTIYLASGLAGGFAQYMISPESNVPMLGASGAIAGVLGAYIVLYPSSRVDTLVTTIFTMRIVQIPAAVALGYWFVTQLFSGVASLGVEAGTAYFAHLGGFVTGVAAALLSRARNSGRRINGPRPY